MGPKKSHIYSTSVGPGDAGEAVPFGGLHRSTWVSSPPPPG